MPHPGVRASEDNVEGVLRTLAHDIETRQSSEATKRQRRQILRGFRAAMWAHLESASSAEIRELLRFELFGEPPTTGWGDDGAMPAPLTEVEDDDN